MQRLIFPADDAMTPEQIAVRSEVVAGPRGKVPSPMIAWIHNPELASRGQKLGETMRFGTTLEARLVELAILVCARHWTAHQVWTSHKRYAVEAGLSQDAIGAIAARRVPDLPAGREQVVFEASAELLARHRICEPVYARAVAALGERGVVELVAVLGYYSFVSLTANAFELGLPASIAPELGDPDAAKGDGS